ncbi:hypothetical protein AF332_23230 [Sporosarcina globispora]|uniref:Uncharacterized protein n=1 Tax=Sporosarcina globispora TaxID=1459 RepID=A0A0M0GHQ6_SPOGL|nr:hypothetical protein AF332_23230 [Sporosarcina globispora]
MRNQPIGLVFLFGFVYSRAQSNESPLKEEFAHKPGKSSRKRKKSVLKRDRSACEVKKLAQKDVVVRACSMSFLQVLCGC